MILSAHRLPGYSKEKRLLILNADDFGFCNAINEGIMGVLEAGIVRSASLMMTCPWVEQAVNYLLMHPQVSPGVHLTVISDPADYRWGPLLPAEKVPSLVDKSGHFYDFEGRHARMNEIDPGELELEFRAQIEAVLAAGLHPSHLDWHSLRIRDWTPIPALITRLAVEYGLFPRVMGGGWIGHLKAQGLPCADRDFLDSYMVDPVQKLARYRKLLHELPAGLNEWAVHPGQDCRELLAIEPNGAHFRQTDFDFWTSPEAKEVIAEEGIILIEHNTLQGFWQEKKELFR